LDHPLIGPRAKVARAYEHLTALHIERRAFLDLIDHRPIGYFDSQHNEYVFKSLGPAPPIKWGILVGEFAHNLRSALDNLLWALIEHRGGTPTKSTQFPIYDDEASWDSKKARKARAGVTTSDEILLKEIQPFYMAPRLGMVPEWMALYHLRELNNSDKHRFVRGVYMITAPGPDALSVFPPDYPARLIPIRDIEVTGEGGGWGVSWVPDERTEIQRTKVRVTGPYPEMKMEGSFVLDVAFNEREWPVMYRNLATLYNEIVAILDRFEDAFN
jgi:hypothetical protein